MSFSVSAVGQKISTRIRQASFDRLNVEAHMYMGSQVVPMYTHELKRSTWSQISWLHLPPCAGECQNEIIFNINGFASNINAMDYLLAIAVEAVFPEVKLVCTREPCCFKYSYEDDDEICPPFGDVNTFLVDNKDNNLYFMVSDGKTCFGRKPLPQRTLFIGTIEALTNTTNGLGADCTDLKQFCRLFPRHRVAWGQNAVLAAIESGTFCIDGVDYEPMDRQAIYNALQFRMREDVYPVAGLEATSMNAIEKEALVGECKTSCAILGECETDRQKAFVMPFSFTTSALGDRGENGKHKSAFPVLLACKNNVCFRLQTICDPRRLLILSEEILRDYKDYDIVFVATATELEVVEGTPTRSLHFACEDKTYIIPASQYVFVSETIDGITRSYWRAPAANATTMEVCIDDEHLTLNRPRVRDFHFGDIDSTCEFRVLTRCPDHCTSCECKFDDIDYRKWIKDEKLEICFRARALTALVTDLERGMMKADCRNRKWLYERYFCVDSQFVCPGDKVAFDFSAVPGQFKYAYIATINETSLLQGNFFNYTNDADFVVSKDTYPDFLRYLFQGKSAVERVITKIQGYPDEDHPYSFYRYVDNALFAQRTPRDRGLVIAPRYANWINAIYPDGSINTQAINQDTVFVKTAKSGSTCFPSCHPWFNKPNTCGYIVQLIAVAWNIAIFELSQCS